MHPDGSAASRLAIRPYPQALESEIRSTEGQAFGVRPIKPEDEPALRRFADEVDTGDLWHDFFAPLRDRTHETAARLSQIDYDREMTLVAWGETHIDSSVAGIAQSTVPIFTFLLAARFLPHEPVGSRHWIPPSRRPLDGAIGQQVRGPRFGIGVVVPIGHRSARPGHGQQRHFACTERFFSGTLGQLQLIKGAFTFTLTREGNFRSVKEMGGGSIWDVGCYPISYARMLAGEPSEVFGWQVQGDALSGGSSTRDPQSKGPDGSDLSFFGQMKFTSGVHAQFDSGFQSPLRSHIEIVGSQASLVVPVPFKPGRTSEIYLRRGEDEERIKIKGQDLYMGEVDDMCDAILLGKPPRISLADSRGNIATILALIESAETGKVVRL